MSEEKRLSGNENTPSCLGDVISRFFNSINEITPIKIEYNSWNGFIITIFGIEYQGKNKGFEGDLFGLHFSKTHLIIYILFIQFDIKSPLI